MHEVQCQKSQERESDWPFLGLEPSLIQSPVAGPGGGVGGPGRRITILAEVGRSLHSGRYGYLERCLLRGGARVFFLVIFRIRKSMSSEQIEQ